MKKEAKKIIERNFKYEKENLYKLDQDKKKRQRKIKQTRTATKQSYLKLNTRRRINTLF